MAWTTPADLNTGDLVSAATWNNQIGATGSLVYVHGVRWEIQQLVLFEIMRDDPPAAIANVDVYDGVVTPDTWIEPVSGLGSLWIRRTIDWSRIKNQAVARFSAIVYMATAGAERARARLYNVTQAAASLTTARCSAANTWELVQSAYAALPNWTTEDNMTVQVEANGNSGAVKIGIRKAWLDIRSG